MDIDASQDFSYDELDRLTTEAGNYGDKTYQYDTVGNRIERVSNFTDKASKKANCFVDILLSETTRITRSGMKFRVSHECFDDMS